MILFLAKVDPSVGDYTIYDGGFLRSPPSDSSRTDDQKTSNGRQSPRVSDRGHYLTLITGKGLNSKDTSKFIVKMVFILLNA